MWFLLFEYYSLTYTKQGLAKGQDLEKANIQALLSTHVFYKNALGNSTNSQQFSLLCWKIFLTTERVEAIFGGIILSVECVHDLIQLQIPSALALIFEA